MWYLYRLFWRLQMCDAGPGGAPVRHKSAWCFRCVPMCPGTAEVPMYSGRRTAWHIANYLLSNFTNIPRLVVASEARDPIWKNIRIPQYLIRLLIKIRGQICRNFQESFFIWFLANKMLNFCPTHIILGSLKAELSELNNPMSKSYVSPIRVAQY